MSIISVNAKELGQELAAWGVPHNYAILFLEKSTVKNGRVALHPFFFNDTEHMTNKRHWLAVNVAYWCCVYREAESHFQQVEALASIRSMYYIAGSLGAGGSQSADPGVVAQYIRASPDSRAELLSRARYRLFPLINCLNFWPSLRWPGILLP